MQTLSIICKAARVELVRFTPDFDVASDNLKGAVKQMQAYGRILRDACKSECPSHTGALAASIAFQVQAQSSPRPSLVLYAGNAKRPEVVVRSNLFGRRGFGPKKAKFLHFVSRTGAHVFTTQVGPAGANGWLDRAMSATRRERKAMIEAIGEMRETMIAQSDVPLANAPHINGYNPKRGATIANNKKNIRV